MKRIRNWFPLARRGRKQNRGVLCVPCLHYTDNFGCLLTQCHLTASCMQEVGLCGEFTLDGRASSGAASRQLSASWIVSSTSAASGAAVSAVESALAPFQGYLLATLNATSLEIGAEFTFTLSVTNFLRGEDNTSTTLTRM